MENVIKLKPIYQERVWGGRTLETLYGRTLPDQATPYGESWEVVDREDEQSVVDGGPLDGISLHSLWNDHRELFGETHCQSNRFPVLVKILDAREKLSIQVHPPASLADELGGEPKTEMWYIAKADPGADLYVGLKEGVTREGFEQGLASGATEEQVHRIETKAGEYIFIPSGRLHAIGSGLVIFEIQQNSDTTYRVFDWNRVGLDGKPRDLHVEESLKCIDFEDVEPGMDDAEGSLLAECDYFRVDQFSVPNGESMALGSVGEFSIIAIVGGKASVGGEDFGPGDFFLVPATLESAARELEAKESVVILKTTLPS